jgi:sodium/proline symporter
MSIKNEAQIDKGKWVAVIFILLTDAAAVTIGILGRIIFTENGQDPEMILVGGAESVLSMLADNFLPYFVAAIYVAIVLSAIMSTIDSLLVIASSAIVRDFYQKIFRPETLDEDLEPLSRKGTLVMALLALGIAMIIEVIAPNHTVFWLIIFGWSGIAASFVLLLFCLFFGTGFQSLEL